MNPAVPPALDAEVRFSGLLRSLHEISLEFSTQPNTDELCRRAVEWALENLAFDRVSLWFVDPSDPDYIVGTWGTDETGRPRDERKERVRRDDTMAPTTFYESKNPITFAVDIPSYDFKLDAPSFDEKRQFVGLADKAVAPLWDGKHIIGELSADNFLRHGAIASRDLDGLVLYARIIGHLYTLIQTREALARASEEKGALLKELKHRTRNNLSVIAGLISLESSRTEGAEAHEKLAVLGDRVEALGALYSQLDREEEPGELRLDEYLGTVATRLAVAHGAESRGVTLELVLEPVNSDAKKASSLGIALNELITDSLKYAFPSGRHGVIRVGLSAAGNEALLQVRDNGVGLPPDLDLGKSGLGLGLVSAIARQVGGSFSAATDGGAVFTIHFKI